MSGKSKRGTPLAPAVFFFLELIGILIGFGFSQMSFFALSGITPSFDFSFVTSEFRFRFSSFFFTGVVYVLCLVSVVTIRYEFNLRKFFTGLPGFQFMFEAWFMSVWLYLLAAALLKLDISRTYFLFSSICLLVFALISRYLARKAVVWSRLRGYSRLDVLLVTTSRAWKSNAKKIAGNKGLGADPKFALTADGFWALRDGRWIEEPGLGKGDVFSFIQNGVPIDLVLVEDARLLGEEGLRELSSLAQREGIQVLVEPGIGHFSEERVASLTFGTRKLLSVKKPNLSFGQLALKRAVDIIVSSVLLVALLPLLGLIALIQILWHGFPVFFTQERIGRNNQKFALIKFRSMKISGGNFEAPEDAYLHGQKKQRIKHKTSDRLTTFGKFLRRHSLDELPQLVNVLLGSMSLVGPRPQVAAEVSLYEGREATRLSVRPGMTGLWQVSGRSNLGWDESIALDLEYVENWSVSRDLVILVKTVREIIKPTGAK